MKIESTTQFSRAIFATLLVSSIVVLLWAVTAQASAFSVDDTAVESAFSAQLSENEPVGDELAVSATYTMYLPIVSRAYPLPVLSTDGARKSGGSYVWTLNWTQAASDAGLEYVIEESYSEDFDSILNTYTTTNASYDITRAASQNNEYYYRVRVNNSEAPYSNVVQVVGAYYNDFNSGVDGWEIVKEDFDDTENVIEHDSGSYLKLHVRGRWDFMMVSDLSPAPPPPYRITTRVKFAGPGNLNTYGLVYGADWNGGTCPVYSISGDVAYSSCFNAYYRNILLWNWGGGTMQNSVKEITWHTAEKNGGRGDIKVEAIVPVSSGSANDWNVWTWEIHEDGTIDLIVNGGVQTTFKDTTYIHRPYWAFWASTDEYPGSDPLFDYVLVEPID